MPKAGSFTAEKYLLDSLNRIAKNPADYSVLYVNVSKLKLKNRHPQFVKIFAKLFEDLVGATNGMMFILTSGDFAILGKKITQETVDYAVKTLRQSLSSDPVLMNSDGAEFAEVYSFPEQFVVFYKRIEEVIAGGELPVGPQKRPVSAAQIEGVISHLDNLDIRDIVKHQSIIRIGGAKKFEVLFQEFFVAVKDLSAQFNKDIDLTANRWLFLYLTQTLDKKTMAAFQSADLKVWPQCISLNLNLSSVRSREFINLVKNFIRPDQKLIVEVQLMDVFNNLSSYFEVREILHQGGHQILIDNTSPEMLHMLNIKRLEPDWVKIFWAPLMEFDVDNGELKQTIAELGSANVILAKCLNENAMRWGLKYGINTFQGPYIDDLEVALIRSGCPNAKNCKVLDCLKRKRLLAGAYRDECVHKECLEKLLG